MRGTEHKIMVAYDQWSYMTISFGIPDVVWGIGVKEYELTVLLCEASCNK
jgi:hypothetical protein